MKYILILLILFLNACHTSIKEYESEKPSFNMREFFNGDLQAWGMFRNRNGKIMNRFYVTMNGSWEGNQGKLKEEFFYADGRKQFRTWNFTMRDERSFTAWAEDTDGKNEGETSGNAFHMNYILKLKVDDSEYSVRMDDWMYLIEPGVALNRTTMSKLGFKIGEVFLTIRKKE